MQIYEFITLKSLLTSYKFRLPFVAIFREMLFSKDILQRRPSLVDFLFVFLALTSKITSKKTPLWRWPQKVTETRRRFTTIII